MFTIVVTGKSGSKRRIEFSKTEISIGRVQENDVILPKGNVSKRHARLVVEDDKYTIADLKSTNGTYVNGKKLIGPQQVSPSDKIYIGDFVLAVAPTKHRATTEVEPDGHPAFRKDSRSLPVTDAPPRRARKNSVVKPAAKTEVPAPPVAPTSTQQSVSDEFRLDQEPDSNADQRFQPIESVTPSVVEYAPDRLGPLAMVMARVAERFDVHNIEPSAIHDQARWNSAQLAISETIQSMRNDGSFGSGVDTKKIANAALHEAVGLGPLDGLLSNEETKEIIVSGVANLSVDRGSGHKTQEARFSSRATLNTIAQRLAGQTGRLLTRNPVFQGVLSFGPYVTIVQAPIAVDGPVIEIRAARQTSIDDLVQGRWLNQDMTDLLNAAIEHRRNVMIVGPQGGGVTTLLSALTGSIAADGRALVIEAIPDLAVDRSTVASFTSADTNMSLGQVVRRVARLRADRLVIDDLSGADLRDALLAVANREPGHLLGVHSAGPNDVAELVVDSIVAEANIDKEVAAGLIAATVHLLVDVRRTGEGHRVLRIDEVRGASGSELETTAVFRYDKGFIETGHRPSFA